MFTNLSRTDSMNCWELWPKKPGSTESDASHFRSAECAGTYNMPIQVRLWALLSVHWLKNEAHTWLSGCPYTKHMHVINSRYIFIFKKGDISPGGLRKMVSQWKMDQN